MKKEINETIFHMVVDLSAMVLFVLGVAITIF